MLSRKANFTFQKPKSNELSIISERVGSKRSRSASGSRSRIKIRSPLVTQSKTKYQKKTINVMTQKKLLELVKNIGKIIMENNEDEEDQDENGGLSSIFEIIQSLFSNRGNVFREENHIYFRGEVTMSDVNELCNLIQQINDESKLLVNQKNSNSLELDPIYLHITSMGGDLLAGFMAFDFIKNSHVPIYTIADGFAVSSGANMFMAGKKRFMRKHSYLLIHQLNQLRCENETSLNALDNAENVSEFMSKLYDIYLDNIRHNRENVPEQDILTKEKLILHMHHDIYWNYDTCLRYGLVDHLYTNINDIEATSIKKQKIQNDDVNVLMSMLLPKIKK